MQTERQVSESSLKSLLRICFPLHAPCLLTLKKVSRLSRPTALGNFSASPMWSRHQRLGAEQDQLPCGSIETSSRNCQKMSNLHGSRMSCARKPLWNNSSGYIGWWATPWSAEEMLYGQRQRLDIPAHARTAHNGLPQKRLEMYLCQILPHAP